jgi:MFS family permease
MDHAGESEKIARPRLVDVLRIRDFRILWIGSFLSFCGSWIQNVAQGYFVYELTGSEAKLAMVSFAGSIPVFILGTIAGSLADTVNPRRVLFWTQIIYAVLTLFLAYSTWKGFVAYWQIVLIAGLIGVTSTIEMPTRQSVVGKVVPRHLLSVAVPAQAMTFNVARIIGPAIGGVLLTRFGVASCYAVNGVSFLALAASALTIRTALDNPPREPQPVWDLISEGARYVWRENRLRTLLILETVTAVFGIFYLPMISAYVDQILGHARDSEASKTSIAHAYTAVGIGAVLGLLTIMRLNTSPHKGRFILIGMGCQAVGLMALAFIRTESVAWVFLAIIGAATMIQFNTTNALFQILSPERLRGRTLSMHIWALNGLSPFGIIALGEFASRTREEPLMFYGGGVEAALRLGSICMFIGLTFGLFQRRHLTVLE